MRSENPSQDRRRQRGKRKAGGVAQGAESAADSKGRRRRRVVRKKSDRGAQHANAAASGTSRQRPRRKRKDGQGVKTHRPRASARKTNGKAAGPAGKAVSADDAQGVLGAALTFVEQMSNAAEAADSSMPSYLDSAAPEISYEWAEAEILLDREYEEGDVDGMVPNIQEWLALHGLGTAIDGDYGPATVSAVEQFQADNGLEETGRTDEETFAVLVSPMVRALQPISPGSSTLGELAVKVAEQHLAEHPREVGGQNRGPWVRLYMEGHDGTDFAWCVGFVCSVVRQAADILGVAMPFDPTFSCDVLAQNGSDEDLFVSESELESGSVSLDDMPPGSVFLNRRIVGDWTHAGLVVGFDDDSFETIEGNTNDEGSREGYEVCRRVRSYTERDFVKMPD